MHNVQNPLGIIDGLNEVDRDEVFNIFSNKKGYERMNLLKFLSNKLGIMIGYNVVGGNG